jgi:hypothetical protein
LGCPQTCQGFGLWVAGLPDGEFNDLANATGSRFGEMGDVLRTAPAQPLARNWRTHLAGDAETLPVDTMDQRLARFEFGYCASQLRFWLNVVNIEDLLACQIRCAPDGAKDPVVVRLVSGGPLSPGGTLAAGTVTASDAEYGCSLTDLEDVLTGKTGGKAYVNVHTLSHPPDEVRGQLH